LIARLIERLDIPVSGGALAAFRIGRAADDSREPVVAVHGITANSRAWLAVARALEGHAALLAPDLRGRAASAALPGPYGIEAYAGDLLAVLDFCGLERAVLVGHSLGAYVVARFAADHPSRVGAAVLLDGGLTQPLPLGVDPQDVVKAALGPALARLEMTFASRAAYRDWWRAHPASDVADEDLAAYADHDLAGSEPELRSGVVADAVRTDASELTEMGKPAQRLSVPVELLLAPRGLLNDANVMIPPDLARVWADADPALRRVCEVPDVNHYTLVMGAAGAGAVAEAIVRALQSSAEDPALRSAR
jgi:pimeloyl-ACP methyl ester carboxylesterase